jgi:hypothetical protein
MRMHHLLAAGLWAFTAAAAVAQPSVCASDGVPRPVAVLERFINADCDECWRDAKTPAAGKDDLVLDWIVPGAKGEDAPLSMGASRDGLARLAALKRKPPAQADAVRTGVARAGPKLRIAHGESFNDYIGTSIELSPGRGGPWDAWLLLVEVLPVGAEGSPVARNLVRNAFQPAWGLRGQLSKEEQQKLRESRPMRIADGARRERLRLVAVVQDAQGHIVAATQTRCEEDAPGRKS